MEKDKLDRGNKVSLSKVTGSKSARRHRSSPSATDVRSASTKISKWTVVSQHLKTVSLSKRKRGTSKEMIKANDFELLCDKNGQRLSRFSSYRDVYRFSAVNRKDAKMNPMQTFKRIAHLVCLLVRVKLLYQRFCCKGSALGVSIEEMIEDKIDNAKVESLFDPLDFKALKETPLGQEAVHLLSLNPTSRTADQIHTAMMAVKVSVPAFNEYPLKMQRQLISVCWYERFESGRTIIREGHQAECFYFILSGKVLVYKTFDLKPGGKEKMKRVARLEKGRSFGELALLHHRRRNATILCKDEVSLLAVGRKDFCEIFMSGEKGKEPEHISYLKSIPYLKDLPLENLVEEKDACLFHYFRRGKVMVNNSESDRIYIAKTGSFRVLTRILKRKLDNRRSVNHIPMSATQNFPLISMNEVKRMRTISREYRSRRIAALPPLSGETTSFDNCRSSDKRRTQLSTLASAVPNKSKYVVVQIEVLKPKDQFVSNGGECILISKEWIISHASETTLNKMRRQIPQYHTQESIQQRLVDQANWKFYKSQTLNDILQT